VIVYKFNLFIYKSAV